jgi:hypothetical protein
MRRALPYQVAGSFLNLYEKQGDMPVRFAAPPIKKTR